MGIYPDKDKQGSLTGFYRVEVQFKGRRARGRFATLSDAQEADLQYRLELTSSVPSVPTAPRSHDKRNAPKTLGQLFDTAKDTLWRGKTTEVQSLQRCMATIGTIGPGVNLHALSTQDIDRLISTITASKSDATVNRYLSALHTLLKWGMTRNYLKAIPSFTWQSEDEGRIRWITEAEEKQLFKHLKGPVADVVKVALATGMRRNEILGLTRDNLEPTWVRLWKTKNDQPRSVPIEPVTYKRLQGLMGHMPTQAQLRYSWDRARLAMGLEDDDLFVFHACRHTCATRLVRANVNIRIIQRWLGHKRIETTLRYSHVNDEMLTEALSKARSHQDLGDVLQFPTSPATTTSGDDVDNRRVSWTS